MQTDVKPLKLYKSSAGSGKTYTLVKEYLRICLPDPERFNKVVAITFTNAAAAEMKERILDRLMKICAFLKEEEKERAHRFLETSELSGLVSDDMARQLLEEGLRPEDIANAPLLLEKMLYNYSGFQVGTIDSFFHKILRSFSKELNLPMDFDIFLETKEALDYAVDEFLQQSYSSPEYQRILIEYIREKINSGHSWGLKSDLQRIARELVKDNSLIQQQYSLEDIHEFIKELRKEIAIYEFQMDALGKQGTERMDELGLSVEQFKYGKSGPAQHFVNIRKENRKYTPGSRFTKATSDIEEWIKKNDPFKDQLEQAAEKYLIGLGRQIMDLYEDRHVRYMAAREVMRSIYTFAVYEEIGKQLQEYRTKNDVVLVSDFTHILAKHIIREQVSFIYSKVGARFDHFLIDEFQDTSKLQWLSLRPLVENAVAQGASCLVVGDSKQAIYRWRGGEIELIERHISEQDFPHHSHKLSLTRNFRSGSNIVSFNNRFFQRIAGFFDHDGNEYLMLESIFSDVAQQPAAHMNNAGYVQVNLFRKEGRSRENFLSKARPEMINAVKQALAEGFGLKDIAFLVRDKKDALLVAQALFGEKIDFITQDSLYLDHSPAIRLLLSLLMYVNAPADQLARTQVLFLYLSYFMENNASPAEIFIDFQKDTSGLYDKTLPEEFRNRLHELATLPVYELTEELVRIFGLNKKADAYIQRFQDVVLEYSLKNHQGAQGFLEWYQSGKYSVVLPESQDAVQIMTIHKSKGLEFPVVIMPFADWDFRNGKPEIIWVESEEEPFSRFEKLPVLCSSKLKETIFSPDFEKEEALTAIDNLNLLYVALTRAKERLYVFSEKENKNAESFKSISQLISEAMAEEMNESNEEDSIIINGERAPHQAEAKAAGSDYLSMDQYPVFDWRSHLLKEEAVSESSFSDLLSKKTESKISHAAALLLPKIGCYSPKGQLEKDDEIHVFDIKNDISGVVAVRLKAYAEALEKQKSKKVRPYLYDSAVGTLQEV